jgi:Tfp pilus assembly protein PilO
MAEETTAKPKKNESLEQLAVWLPALIAVVAVLYAGLAWFYLFVPKIGPLLKGGKYDYTPLIKQIQDEENYTKKVNTALTEYNKIQSQQRKNLGYVIPVGPNFPSLMAQLEQIGLDNHMLLESLDVATGVGEPVASATPMQITMAFSGGNEKDFTNLLEDIETSIRLIDIQKFQYSPNISGYQLVGLVYYLPTTATP